MKPLVILLMFLTISALIIISNNNLYMYKAENFEIFSDLYLDWANKIYSNFQVITGKVIELNWLPDTQSEK